MWENAEFGGFLMYFLSFLTGFFNTSMGEFFNQDKVEEEVQEGRFFIILLK